MKLTPYEIYVFILCFIVFLLLTALFTTMIVYIVRLIVRLIRHGAEDERIKIEYSKKRRCAKCWDVISVCFSSFVCFALLLALIFSMCIGASEELQNKQSRSLKVVKSESMATKYEENDYLDFYNLDDQIQMFDLIVVHELPPEDEIELYDIVVYEINNMLIIHRIVGIEEPDESHPDERYFLLQGDSNEVPDRFPVLYSQMRGIYRGERMPFVGSFITFLQSPAGWLCFLLILFATIATPIVERILEREMEKRWRLLQKKAVLQKYSAILDQTKMAAEEKKASRLELAKLYFLRLDLHSSKHPQRDRQYTFKFADTNFFFNKKKK